MGLSLQVGVTSWKSGSQWTADTLCQQGEVAQTMGFHSFWLPENHFGDDLCMPSPLTLLAAVAARTQTIKLGTASYLLPIRHPLLAAEEVAVLDQLSEGRVILGVGRGVQSSVFKAFDSPSKEKRQRFAENLAIMRKAWAGEPILHDEEKPVYLAPLPIQRPYPPVWVAAFGPLALKQVGNLGLPYLASPVETLGVLQKNYADYHQVVQEAGLPAVTTIPAMRTVFISDDKGQLDQLKQRLTESVPSIARDPAAGVDDWALVGDKYQVRDKLHEYIDTLAMTHLIAIGRLPGVEISALIRSHEALLECIG
jgi:alkanesulfonate monooxygenase SsuD/methylene tetrahydromethanopterin reductase-like flavin-dependent oxidoreductase (luciferase family)